MLAFPDPGKTPRATVPVKQDRHNRRRQLAEEEEINWNAVLAMLSGSFASDNDGYRKQTRAGSNDHRLFSKVKPNHRHWYAYDVLLDGETIVFNSRDPEHDLARALRARGIKGSVQVLDGKTGRPRCRVNIKKAGKWCVGSNLESFKWKPAQTSGSCSHAGERHQPGRGAGLNNIGPSRAALGEAA